jgi:predicted TIM-barrel fold metal-dependent hydrolase
MELLPEIGEKRFKSMDDAGITVQVLSNSGAGPDLVPGPDGIALAKGVNDHLADAVTKHPKRFAGFAALPMATPDACADELRRAVKDLKFVGAMIHGTTEGRFLDHPSYDGLLAAAVELDVPIYIHPNVPSMDVRQAYYSNLPEGSDRVLATAGWGWHSEVAIHILRMVMAGTFDKHPKLKMIIGHMGEMLRCAGPLDEVSAADADTSSGRPAAPSSIRSGSPPAASSASRRSSPRCKPSASTGSCSRSIIRSRRTRADAISSTRSRSRRLTWRSSATAMRTRC